MKQIRFSTMAATTSLILALFGGPASAEELIDATMPAKILEMAKGYGSATLEKDSDGDPKITGRIDGTRYALYFFGCNKGNDCDDLLFHAAWSVKNISLDSINTWNATKRYGKAYKDSDGDIALQMPVTIDHGVSKRNLEDSFTWWKTAVQGFLKDVLDQ